MSQDGDRMEADAKTIWQAGLLVRNPMRSADVEHLRGEEISHELKVRAQECPAGVKAQRSRLRRVLQSELRGSIGTTVAIPVDIKAANDVSAAVAEMAAEIAGYTVESLPARAAGRLAVRLTHYLYRVGGFPKDDPAVAAIGQRLLEEIPKHLEDLDNLQLEPTDVETDGEEGFISRQVNVELPETGAESQPVVEVVPERVAGPSQGVLCNRTPRPEVSYFEDGFDGAGAMFEERDWTRHLGESPLRRPRVSFAGEGGSSAGLTQHSLSRARPDKYIKCHQWGLTFTGDADSLSVYAFLEKLALKLRVHGVSWEEILPHMSELLGGTAYRWYVSRLDRFTRWEDFELQFRSAFGIPNYRAYTLREIATTQQDATESVTSYVSRMRILFRRCPEKLSENAQLALVIGGALPKYQDLLVIPPFTTLDEVEHMLRRLEVSRSTSVVQHGTREPELERESKPSIVEIEEIPKSGNTKGSARSGTARQARFSSAPRFYSAPHAFPRYQSPQQSPGGVGQVRFAGAAASAPRAPIHCYGCGKPGVIRRHCEVCRSNGPRAGSGNFPTALLTPEPSAVEWR
uniref:Retrotransposon gag domain-containing protein n=2 Tax=Cacopsylla melanoneura TaxID=428564 RepID=A0A8D8UDQ9_9HEMI